MRYALTIALGLSTTAGIHAQAATQKPKAPRQYKRIHQNILKPLLNGNLQKTRKQLEKHLERDATDPETWYLKTIVDAQDGKVDDAVRAMEKALALKFPPQRFLAGPRTLLAKVATSETFRALETRFAHRPIHGPMLGVMTGESVNVWLRTATASQVTVVAIPKDGGDPRTARGATTAASDFTAVVQLRGLTPSTDYEYTIRIGDGGPVPGGRFRTFAKQGEPLKLRIAFGGGAGYVPQHERMWDTIGSFAPDALLLLGDNVYSDAPKHRELQRYCYYRRQSRPEFRKLTASVPVWTIWDDHDFGVNDCFYGDRIDVPAWKPKVMEVFRQNWVNPGYGTAQAPGCFYDFVIGDLWFGMLDGRFYRMDPKKENPSMLGPAQNAWIRARLKASKSRLKFLCSPVPWTFEAKGKSKDTWNGFQAERNRLFDFIGKARLEGVVLLSADRHRTDIWKLAREGHYAFTEFNSSRLTNQHVHKTMKQAEFSYNKKQSFGLIEIDTTAVDPTITMKVVSIDGEVVHTKKLRGSDLRYK